MKKVLFVLVLLVASTATVFAESRDSVLVKYQELANQQKATADSLISQLFQEIKQPTPFGYDPLFRSRKVFLTVEEVSADNAGWLWSRMTDQDMRSGTISQEDLFYHEVVVDTGLASDIIGHYQQTLLYQDNRFRLVEQVWFHEETYWSRVFLGYFIAIVCGAAIVLVIIGLRPSTLK